MKPGIGRCLWGVFATLCALMLTPVVVRAQDRSAPQIAASHCLPVPGMSAGGAGASVLDANHEALLGFWTLSLRPEGAPTPEGSSVGLVLLEPHPEFPGSVRGSLRRSEGERDLQAWVAGDVSNGVFLLDESEDGVAMSAVWEGELPAAACGNEITGLRRAAEGTPNAGQRWHFRLLRSTQLR